MLAAMLAGCVLIFLTDTAEQLGLVSELAHDVVKTATWSVIVGILLWMGYRSALPLGMIIALLSFAVFSVGAFALSLVRDLPIPRDLPLLGRGAPMHDVTTKFFSTGWAISLAYLFYRLICMLAEQTRALAGSITRLEHEIAERENIARLAQESERKLRLVTDRIPAYIAYIDAQQRIRFVNKQDPEFDGLPQEQIVGRSVHEVIGEKRYASVKPHVDAVLGGRAVTFEKTLDNGREGTRTITSSFIPDVEGDGNVAGYYAVTIDVTELRQSEKQLQQFREELVHAGRLSTVGEMAAGMAHELNQPLSAISTYCFAARRSLRHGGENGQDISGLLSKLEDQALRAGRIIERLRALTRKTPSERVEVDINRLVRDVLELTDSELRQHEIRLSVRLDEQLPPVFVDAVQIQQVLLNLIQNAIDAMRDVRQSQRRLEISTFLCSDDRVEVMVRDSGCGISADEERRLFTPFFTTKSKGTGMGLAISRSIIETHEGRIWLKRNMDRGAAFCFTLAVGNPSCPAT